MERNTDQDFYDFLQSFPGLTDEDRSFIAEHSRVEPFPKGTMLLREGQVSKQCFTVLKGCVRKYYIVDGNEKTVALYTEGQPVVSFSSYIDEVPADHYLECAEDCLLGVGTKDLEDWMCENVPNLAAVIREEVEKNNGKDQKEFAAFMLSTPEERYLTILNERPDLLDRIPQHQIASYIGVKPESLSRIRKRLVKRTV